MPKPLTLRRLHGYTGMLIAPSVLFFALTGSLQLFSLHEAHDSYTPPSLFVTLGSFHKDQRPPRPHKADAPAQPKSESVAPAAAPKPATPPVKKKSGMALKTMALKWVFLFVALGLVGSTLVGIWMALQDKLRRTLNLILLAVGTVVPLVLALI